MWWKTDRGYVNMKHMATLTIEGNGVFANEIAEQSKYLIKECASREEAEKLAGEIIRAEK